MRRRWFLVFLALCASGGAALAVGWKTQFNCANDYYAYCSAFPVGSSAVRKCMRANGPRLSSACINALIADGEISKEEVAQEKRKSVEAKKKKNNIVEADSKKKPVVPKNRVAESKREAKGPRPSPKVSQAVAAAAKPTPKRQDIVLDQETFEALKRRNRFVVDDEIKISSISNEAHDLAIRQGTDIEDPKNWSNVRIIRGPTKATVKARSVGKAESMAEVRERKSPEPAGYLAGRMSLGSNLASVRAEPPPQSSLWDKLVRLFSGGEQ
jgi:hypothetical protein